MARNQKTPLPADGFSDLPENLRFLFVLDGLDETVNFASIFEGTIDLKHQLRHIPQPQFPAKILF